MLGSLARTLGVLVAGHFTKSICCFSYRDTNLVRMSLEYATLGKCVTQLESALGFYFKEITIYLFGEGFIADELYMEFLEPQSTYSSAEKATKLVLQIMSRVSLEPVNYYKLINYLRLDKRKYGDIVEVLDAEYFGIRKVSASRVSHGQQGMLWFKADCSCMGAPYMNRRGVPLGSPDPKETQCSPPLLYKLFPLKGCQTSWRSCVHI